MAKKELGRKIGTGLETMGISKIKCARVNVFASRAWQGR